MSFSWYLQCSFTISFLSIAQTVPPDYCLAPLNRSDCDAPPKLVFSYYKPGSRCESQIWRGCPTLNKFENEYLCTLNCIFKMRTPVIEENRNPCDIPLNKETCGGTSSLVYTYISGSCEPVMWSGCPSQNKFITKSICEAVCQVVPHAEPYVEKLFFELDEKPLEEISDLLEHIIEEEAESTNDIETEPKKEATTETQTVTIAEEPGETPAEEPAETPAEEPTETPAEEPGEEPSDEPAEEPVEEPPEEPAEELAEEPAEEPADEPAEEQAEEPAEEPAEELDDFEYM